MCLYISIADQQHSNVHEMFGHHFTPSFTHTHTQSIYAIYIDKSKMHFKTSLSKGTCDDLLTRKQLQQLDVLGSVLFPFSHQKICRSILPKHESDFCESKCLYTTVPSGLFTQLSDVISQVQPQGISSQYIRRTYAYMAITNQHALSLDCMQAARGLELQVARGLQRPEHSTVPAKGH